MRHPLAHVTCVACLLLAGSAAQAQTNGTWNVNAAGNWSTTTNWLGGTVPGSGGVATFGDSFGLTTGRTVTQDVVGLTLSGMTFNTPFQYTISGANAITLAPGFTINAQTSNAVSPSTFGNGAFISTVLAGAGGLVKTGVGTATLTAANTFTGGVTINQGELRITGGNGSLGDVSNSLTIDGGTLRVSSSALTTTRNVTIGTNGAEIRTFAAVALNGTLTGTGSLTKNIGGVTLTIGGDGSGFTGKLSIQQGTVLLNANGTLGGTSSVDLFSIMSIDNTATNLSNRIADTRGFNSRGGQFNFTGNAAGSTETVGTLQLDSGNTIVTSTSATTGSTLTLAGLTRNNKATVLFRGTNLGNSSGAVGNIAFNTSPGPLFGAGGDPTTSTTASILAFATGSTSATATTGTTFVTWDSGTGRIVPLNLATGYTTDINTSTAGDNVNQNASVVVAAPTTINALRVAPTSSITISGAPITINSGAILSTSLNSTTLTTISSAISAPSGREIIIHAASGAITSSTVFGGTDISGVISGDSGLTKAGNGVLRLSGANTYTGTTTLNSGTTLISGTIDPNVNGAFGNSNTAIVLSAGSSSTTRLWAYGANATINRDIVVQTGGSTLAGIGCYSTEVMTINGNIQINNAANSPVNGFLSLEGGATLASGMVINGVISGNGGVSDTVSPVTSLSPFTTLNGANTYSGGTQMNNGTYILGNNSALGTGRVDVNGASTTILAGGGARTIGNNFVVVGNGITFGGTDNLTLAGGFDLNGVSTVTVNTNPGVLTLSGVVSRGTMIKAGAGTLVLTNTGNTFTGAIQVRNGTVIAAGNAGLASGVLGTYPTTNISNILLADASSAATDNIAFLTNGAFTIAKQIQVNANNTTGTITIGGTNTSGTANFTGFIGLNRGATPTATQFTSSAGGTVNFSGQILEFLANSSVRVIGDGRVVFSRAAGNTYTGGTTINSGATLLVTNTSGSGTGTGAVTVNGTLGGTGIITGAVTVGSGGHLSPGLSPGKLTVSNNVTFQAGSTFDVELNGTAAGQFDQLVVTGAANTVTLDTTGLGVLLNASIGYQADTADILTIIDNQTNNAIVGTFAGLSEGSIVPIGASWYGRISYIGGTGNDLVLFGITPVPEPGTFVLVGAAAVGVALARLRRRRVC